jgi:hypothetical protein
MFIDADKEHGAGCASKKGGQNDLVTLISGDRGRLRRPFLGLRRQRLATSLL